MAIVTLDLYPNGGGRYAVDWKIGTGRPWAGLAGSTADLHVSTPPPAIGARRLTFREAVRYPHGLEPLTDAPGSIYVYIYRPIDRETILDFDRRINVRYTEFFDATGEHPAGTFDVEGLSSPCLGELAAMDATSRADYERATAELRMPDDIEAIVAECRTLQDRSWERYVLWLTPLTPGDDP
jgi:hypothetical protein